MKARLSIVLAIGAGLVVASTAAAAIIDGTAATTGSAGRWTRT